MTRFQWLQFAAHELRALPEARLVARLLLDGATGARFSHLVAPDEPLPGERISLLKEWLARAQNGEPAPYILGSAPFFGRDWGVEAGVLIPRSETELLVEAVLQSAPFAARIAELGTGSGIIAGTLSLERPHFSLWATELSPVAREVAKRNWETLGARVELIEGAEDDWLGPLQSLAPFDTIVSNPPYIPSHDLPNLQASVRDFEPRLALDGGADGLNPYRQIAASGRELLREGGFVALEVGHDQKAAIEALFGDWGRLEWRFDVQNIARVALVRK